MNHKGQKAICILGMHRSGTSAVARALNLLGPYIGRPEHMMKPVEGDNPQGFWENMLIYTLHEKILSSLSSSWDSIMPPPGEWWKQPVLGRHRGNLINIIEHEFGGHDLWMWKDPRTSLLLPFWQNVAQERGIEISCVISIRNPLDVAASLKRRNRIPESKSLSLWLLYTLSALHYTAHEKRVLVSFDDLIEDPVVSLKKISTSLDIPWPADDTDLRNSLTDFLRPVDRHSRSETSQLLDDKNAAEPVKKTYSLIMEALEKDDAINSSRFSDEIENIYRNYCTYGGLFTSAYKGPGMSSRNIHNIVSHGGKKEEEHPKPIKTPEIRVESRRPPEELGDLVLPVFPAVRVSIIIPVWNRWEYTYGCLKSIISYTDDVAYEVIIVDNGSSDRTGELIAKALNLRVLNNQSNEGYVRACNQGANIARGEYLVFLNNDTTVTKGWLKALTGLADEDKLIGAAGARLILADGTLQEAGCIVWSDGSTEGYGRGENPDAPQFSFVRDVDYCSAACLLVRKHIFFNLGGFDETYSPAYYEDVDLCFELKRLGYRVVYQPEAKIIHCEFGSSSKDAALDLYLKNMTVFAKKWRVALDHRFSREKDSALLARDSRQWMKVLVLDGRTDSADLAGPHREGSAIGVLSDFGCIVTVFSFLSHEDCIRDLGTLRARGVELFSGKQDMLEDFLRERARFYDAILVFRPEHLFNNLQSLKVMFPSALIMYDIGNLAIAAGAERDKLDLGILLGADVIIVSTQNMAAKLGEHGLHNCFVWEYAPDRQTAESGIGSGRRFAFAGMLRNKFHEIPFSGDRCGIRLKKSIIQEMQSNIDEIKKYAMSLEEAIGNKDEYIASLLEAQSKLDEIRKYAMSLEEAIGNKDKYITSLLAALKEKDRYINSLLEERKKI